MRPCWYVQAVTDFCLLLATRTILRFTEPFDVCKILLASGWQLPAWLEWWAAIPRTRRYELLIATERHQHGAALSALQPCVPDTKNAAACWPWPSTRLPQPSLSAVAVSSSGIGKPKESSAFTRADHAMNREMAGENKKPKLCIPRACTLVLAEHRLGSSASSAVLMTESYHALCFVQRVFENSLFCFLHDTKLRGKGRVGASLFHIGYAISVCLKSRSILNMLCFSF